MSVLRCEMDTSHEHVLLASDLLDATGRPAKEEIPARKEAGSWRLLSSPSAVYGVAAGDLVTVTADHEFAVLARGGNVCIQIFLEQCSGRELAWLEQRAHEIDANVDAIRANSCALTVPARVGHRAVTAFMASFVAANPGALWQYGNVWDPETEEPLAWAQDYLSR
jgi:hypothetical protein